MNHKVLGLKVFWLLDCERLRFLPFSPQVVKKKVGSDFIEKLLNLQIVCGLMAVDRLQEEFESLCSDLLQWVHKTITNLSDRHFPNSQKGVQDLFIQFKNYRTIEKPPK